MMTTGVVPRAGDLVLREARPDDAEAVRALLRAASLPLDGTDITRFVVAESAGTVVGCAGLEVHNGAALLRSVAVSPDRRGIGVGEALVHMMLGVSDAAGISPVVLLTTTAAAWFPRFGFAAVSRADVPAPLRDTVEFTSACPDTATVMLRTAPPVTMSS